MQNSFEYSAEILEKAKDAKNLDNEFNGLDNRVSKSIQCVV